MKATKLQLQKRAPALNKEQDVGKKLEWQRRIQIEGNSLEKHKEGYIKSQQKARRSSGHQHRCSEMFESFIDGDEGQGLECALDPEFALPKKAAR